MKYIIMISCLSLLGFFCTEKANNKDPNPSIALKGKLEVPGPIRNPQTPPVEAFQNATDVLLVFNGNLGSLNIEVLEEVGDTVFKTTVNATTGSTLTINTGSWESGTYTLLITDGLGGYLEGIFEIE